MRERRRGPSLAGSLSKLRTARVANEARNADSVATIYDADGLCARHGMPVLVHAVDGVASSPRHEHAPRTARAMQAGAARRRCPHP
jgi:hypothetical protein